MAMKQRTGPTGRFSPLLVALVVMFLAYPVLSEFGRLRFFRLFFLLVLMAAVYTLSENRRHLVIAAVLAAPSLFGSLFAFARPSVTSALWASVFAMLLLGFVTVLLLKVVLQTRDVRGDTIAGAICVYLLLGLTWAAIFSTIEGVWPGSFSTPANIDLQDPNQYSLIYFSFVTLTTLGYGEFTPTTEISQSFAWIEAVVGQLFVAILIARLVTQYSREKEG